MVEHNDRVIEALNRYVTMPQPPNYAIMLNGAWGCGKTYFVREKWLKDLKNKEKYSIINVSLFGLNTVDELREEIAHNKIIFEEALERNEKANIAKEKVEELLNNNLAQGFGSIVNKIISAKIGVGFNDITKMFTRDWLSENKKGITKILILDDLERAKMDLKEIFGFISSYIESTGLRVIFLSNDEEIETTEKVRINENIKIEDIMSKDKTEKTEKKIETIKELHIDEDYTRIREKVIGETLKIEPDIDDTITHFFEEMSYTKTEKQLIDPLIRETREMLGCKNLRVVRQTLMKLQPLLSMVAGVEEYKNYPYQEIEISGKKYPKEHYLKSICKMFMIVNMKKVMGDLKEEAIGRTFIVHGYALYQPLTQEVKDKELGIWVKYIWGCELNNSLIKLAVEKDMETIIPQYIMEKDTIFKLQVGYWDYGKDEFYELQAKMVQELKEGVYTELRALMAAYALLVTFEKDGILDGVADIDILFDEVIKKITTIISGDDKLGHNVGIDFLGVDFCDYRGYQLFFSADKLRVEAFLEKVKKAYKSSEFIDVRKKIEELVEQIIGDKKDIHDLIEVFRGEHASSNTISIKNVPALDWIGADKLWKVLDETSVLDQRRLIATFRSRYGSNTYLFYKKDKVVLEGLVKGYTERFNKAKQEKDNKVSIYKYLKDDTEKVLDIFNEKIRIGEELNKK